MPSSAKQQCEITPVAYFANNIECEIVTIEPVFVLSDVFLPVAVVIARAPCLYYDGFITSAFEFRFVVTLSKIYDRYLTFY